MSTVVYANTEVQVYALKSIDGKFEPWSYHPRILHDDEVEVAITHCGICATDIHQAYNGWGMAQYPMIVGHEIVGNISKVGAAVSDFAVGDRVGIGAQAGACCDFGTPCTVCATGDPNHCAQIIPTYGGAYPDGERAHGGYASMRRKGPQERRQISCCLGARKVSNVLRPGGQQLIVFRHIGISDSVYHPHIRCFQLTH